MAPTRKGFVVMFTKSSRRLALVSGFAIFLLTACASSGSGITTTTSLGESDFDFGEPADSATSDRVVEILTTDDLVFVPAELTVRAGETVTFRIVNQGATIHDFTLGDEAMQEEHEEAMGDMGGMAHDQANAVTVAAGESKELTWTFTQPGTVLIGCHQPGHYDGGMKGKISVEA
jgi:uncharacterized cupredoxin-like copper-binding protein